MILGGILITLAAFFKAASDSMAHHPEAWPNTPFWNPLHPLNDKVKRIGGYPLDGWHISNSLMIVSFISIVFVSSPFVNFLEFVIYGVWFVVVFNIFYNKVMI